MSNFGNKWRGTIYSSKISLSGEIHPNPTIQLIDSLVRARIAKTFLKSNPSLKNFSWLRTNKIGRNGAATFHMGLTGAPWKILPAVVNFGKIVKF